MKKIFSIFMVRKFVVQRVLNRINGLVVVKKINAEIVTDTQILILKFLKKIN
jgi:hypothetical protein